MNATCKQAGVIGAMGGVIGSLQAMEAIKYILGIGNLLTVYLLTYDALKMEFRLLRQNIRDTLGRCRRLIKRNEQFRHSHHGECDLRHIVDEGGQFALRQVSCIHTNAAKPEHSDDSHVHDKERGWVENRAHPSHDDGPLMISLVPNATVIKSAPATARFSQSPPAAQSVALA